jgi:hypothetical protein
VAEKEEQWRALRALEHIRRPNRQMTNDDIAYLRLLADWHGRQAHDLLLTVAYDQGHFHSLAAARLSRFADESGVAIAQHSPSFTGINGGRPNAA